MSYNLLQRYYLSFAFAKKVPLFNIRLRSFLSALPCLWPVGQSPFADVVTAY